MFFFNFSGKLTHLDASSNFLANTRGLNELDDVSGSITHLLLAYNQINLIPDFFRRMARLQVLDLSHNEIVTLPPSTCLFDK